MNQEKWMSNSLQNKLTHDQITVIFQHGFGSGVKLNLVQPLEGGTFNETYLIELEGKPRMVLRVAPPDTADVYWDDVALMRREYHVLPFFAPIADLMPSIVLTDFTHQIVDRDYMFQTFIEGERWSDIESTLSVDENNNLWQQCGRIVRRIHNTTGERFGYPYPGPQFKSWSGMILDRFAKISESLMIHKLEIPSFAIISGIVHANASLLDEIQTPSLLHGDLWTFNLLISQNTGEPTITGVLDVERAWWGDPLADWIMFLLDIRNNDTEWQGQLSAFNKGYGKSESNKSTQFRQEIYKAMHIGTSAIWATRHGDTESILRARQELGEIAQVLPPLSE
jgi:aminoglycoside phosphotransferase (APT) family kinase protein